MFNVIYEKRYDDGSIHDHPVISYRDEAAAEWAAFGLVGTQLPNGVVVTAARIYDAAGTLLNEFEA